nr:lysylphosphatidylglycerol synthase transmembrane domain-containing protein [uncultured Chryseobacterium sp.]
MKSNWKKASLKGLKIVISAALLYFVVRKIPFKDIIQIWSALDIFYLIMGAVFFLISQIISAKRLEFYFNAHQFNLNFSRNLTLYFLGMFYNFFIPGGIGGDAYKIYILHKNHGWSVKKLTASIFNDRLSGLLAICCLILIFSTSLLSGEWLLINLAILASGVIIGYLILKKIFPVYRRIYFKTLFISLSIQLLQSVSFVCLLKSLQITDNFTVYIIVFLCSSILSLISFAGIGAREFLFLKASALFHFSSEISVSASLLFTLVTAFFSLTGLFVMMQNRKL